MTFVKNTVWRAILLLVVLFAIAGFARFILLESENRTVWNVRRIQRMVESGRFEQIRQGISDGRCKPLDAVQVLVKFRDDTSNSLIRECSATFQEAVQNIVLIHLIEMNDRSDLIDILYRLRSSADKDVARRAGEVIDEFEDRLSNGKYYSCPRATVPTERKVHQSKVDELAGSQFTLSGCGAALLVSKLALCLKATPCCQRAGGCFCYSSGRTSTGSRPFKWCVAQPGRVTWSGAD